jgi:hypothetical protein
MTTRTVLIATDATEVKLVAAFNALVEKLTSAALKIDTYVAERTALELASNIEVGQEVSFLFGRGESRVTETGSVAVVVDTPAGKLLKVIVDSGLATMRVRDVRLKDATVVGADPTPEQQGDAALATGNEIPFEGGVKQTPEQIAEAAQQAAVDAVAGASGAGEVDVDALIAGL